MARKKSPTLLPDTSCLQLVRLEADEQSLIAIAETTSSEALCPLCQCRSESIHSRYTRVVADLLMAQVGRCGSKCMHHAFSAETRNVRVGSLTFRLPTVVAP